MGKYVYVVYFCHDVESIFASLEAAQERVRERIEEARKWNQDGYEELYEIVKYELEGLNG